MSLTPEQEKLKKVWLAYLAQKELSYRDNDLYANLAKEALDNALRRCWEAGFDPRNSCSEVYLPVSEKPCSLTPPDPEPPAKPMTKYNRTIRTVIITPEDDIDSPIYSEKAISVSVEDEAGGPFIVLTTNDEISGRGEIRLDAEELWEAAKVAKELMEQNTLTKCAS